MNIQGGRWARGQENRRCFFKRVLKGSLLRPAVLIGLGLTHGFSCRSGFCTWLYPTCILDGVVPSLERSVFTSSRTMCGRD